MSDPPRLRYVESAYYLVPGEGSWSCPSIHRRPRLARAVQAALLERRGVHEVRANPWTGRVRVVHGPGITPAQIVAAIEAAAFEFDAGAATPGSSLPPLPLPEASDLVELRPVRRNLRRVLALGGVGLGLTAVVRIVRRSLDLFPVRIVGLGLAVGAATTAGLVWVNLHEARGASEDPRRRALQQLLARFARPYGRRLVVGLATTFLGRVAYTATLTSVGSIVDAALSPTHTVVIGRGIFARRVGLFELGLISVGLIFAANALDYYSRRTFMHAAHRISSDLRVALYAHVQSLEMRELADTNRGTFLTVLNEDVNRVTQLFSSVWMVSRELSFAFSAVGAFYLQHPGFAGMVAIPMPGLMWIGQVLERRIRARVDGARRSAGELGGTLSSALDGIETIRAFAREQTAIGWVADGSDAHRRKLDASLDLTALYDPLAVSAGHALRAITAFVAGDLTGRGALSTGNYVKLVMLSAMIALPLRGIARDLPYILSTLASLTRVFEVFAREVEDLYGGQALDRADVQGHLELRGVDFAYPTGQAVFRDFSVEIPAGKITAFVGETGSGKSTVAKLLLRFYDHDAGEIVLDGRPLSAMRRSDVRRCIAYTSQDIFLFNGTVAQNIAFSEDDVDHELVVAAAEAAEAAEFIAELPQGYETLVGERGQKLSGGQRQRIGIARALYSPRPIVILDEVTSALDAVTEAKLHERLAKRLVGCTVIVIAHRLSAVRNADRIHVLESGVIVESGHHEELLRIEGGRYARFWELQTRDEGLPAS